MYLVPSQCTVVGQRLSIKCNTTSCSGGFKCRNESVCPANTTEIDGKCFREEDEQCKGGGIGNPCDPATGNKFQREIDFKVSDLSIERTYNSVHQRDGGFGVGWTMPFGKKIEVGATTLGVEKSNGVTEALTQKNGLWYGDQDTDFTIVENALGFLLTKPNGDIEQYNQQGLVIEEAKASGKRMIYNYNANGFIVSITDHFGRSLSLAWNNYNHINTITDPTGNVYAYTYDSLDRLTKVTYPDETTRKYHYENSGFPTHLTGITDENGVRYATFAYDSQGRAISTEHANVGSGAQEKFQIYYGQ
jgi:YD repeat-containing protein